MTVTWRAVATALLLCVAAASCAVSPQSQQVVRADTSAPLAPAELSCEYRWSAPQDLLSFDGRPTYVETPTAAVTDTGLLLVGTPSFFWATRTAFDPPPGPTSADTAEYYDRLRTNHSNVGMSLDARMRARGVHFPARPGGLVERAAIAADSAGGVHLYYATRPEDSVALWHTRLYGTLWTVPQRLLTESELYWPRGEVRGGREMHLAMTFSRAGTGARSGSGVAYLRHGGGGTRVVLHFQRGMPMYASVLPYGDSLLIAFNGMDPSGRGDNGSHVFLIRASVHDSEFPPARRLHWSGSRVASWPRLFLDSSSARGRQLGVLWASAAQGEAVEAADSLHVMVSRDGVSWSPPESVELPQPARHMSVVSSTGIGIHGVTHPQKEGERATYFHWRGGAWRRLEVLPFAGIASLPSLMHVRRDSLLLIWGEARTYPGAPPEAPRAPVSRFAWLGSSCTY